MDIKSWSSSRSRTIQFGRFQNQLEYSAVNTPSTAAGGSDRPTSIWKVLWSKIQKERKKIISSKSPSPAEFLQYGINRSPRVALGYDEYNYSLNFDQGLIRNEPEYLTRSFSVQFASPSRMFAIKRS